jgi:hypothetical protein
MSVSSEVLIYIQKVKNFFENDQKAKEYFLINVDESFFYHQILQIAKDNFEKNGDPTLNVEQFEEIKNILDYKLLNKTYNTSENKQNIDVFIEHKGFENICLN